MLPPQLPHVVFVPSTLHEPVGDVVGALNDVRPEANPELQQYSWMTTGGEGSMIVLTGGETIVPIGAACVWIPDDSGRTSSNALRIPQKNDSWQPSDVAPVLVPQP